MGGRFNLRVEARAITEGLAMTPATAAENLIASSGLDGAGLLRVCAEVLIRIEPGTTCDMGEILTLLRKIVVGAEKPRSAATIPPEPWTH